MIIAERQSRLRDLLARRGMSDLESLSAELNVSQSTIRRDVELLVRSGHVRARCGRTAA
jgi:DeoR family transcriptional regulator, fructose operon transcriptional repressor